MASCANRHHFSLLQHSFPFGFLQICEFANASAGPPSKVAQVEQRTSYLSFQKEGLVVSFLLSCIGKCFSSRLQTLLISCWPHQEMFAIPLETGNEEKHQEDIWSLQQLGTLRYWTSDNIGQRPNNESGQQQIAILALQRSLRADGMRKLSEIENDNIIHFVIIP